MTVKVRPADLEGDRDEIVALLTSTLNPAYDHRRFNWLYTENPAGTGLAWVAVDSDTGAIVGTAGASPRMLCVGSDTVRGWVLSDFCVAAAQRTLGPALLLQRTCLAALAADGPGLWYDFPGARMVAVYRRLGIEPASTIRRMARLLRIDQRVDDALPRPLRGPAKGIGNLLLSLRDRRLRHESDDVTVDVLAGRCTDEFTALADTAMPAASVRVHRSAPHLNWRYLASPVARHEILTARRRGTLIGYCVVVERQRAMTVVDLFPTSPEVTSAILGAVTRIARARGLTALNTFVLDSDPSAMALRRLGFAERESAPVVTSLPSGGGIAGTPPWFLTYGDRDS